MSAKLLNIEVKPHPITFNSPNLVGKAWVCIVTNKSGKCYFISYVGEKPTDEYVLDVWKNNRREFQPYIS